MRILQGMASIMMHLLCLYYLRMFQRGMGTHLGILSKLDNSNLGRRRVQFRKSLIHNRGKAFLVDMGCKFQPQSLLYNNQVSMEQALV
jgi:hypothetical protein